MYRAILTVAGLSTATSLLLVDSAVKVRPYSSWLRSWP